MAAALGSPCLKLEVSSWAGLRAAPKSAATAVVAAPARKWTASKVSAALGGEESVQMSAAQSLQVASISASSSVAPAPVPTLLGVGTVLGAVGFAAVSKFTAKEVPVAAAPAPPAAESTNGAVSKFNKRAAPAALATISYYFPNAMQDESFVSAVAEELFNLGFSRDNCIALVNTCRDEVCRPLATYIDQTFGLSFNVSGLGGLINCGKTGFKAGMSHSPEFPCDKDGKPRERYVFFAFPHVSIGESGEVGSLLRRGRGKPSSACGALIAIKNSASDGEIADDDEDAEYITLKRKVLSQPVCRDAGPLGPSLVDVTKASLQVITDDLELLISKTVNPETSDYAVITGVQIHSGAQVPGEPFRLDRTVDYVAPGTMYAVIRGEKSILHCEVNQISAIKSVSAQLVSA